MSRFGVAGSTLGGVCIGVAFIWLLVFFADALVKIASRRLRESRSSSHMLIGVCLRSVYVILLAAAIIASVGVVSGFVMWLCFKKTVPDTFVAFVFVVHMFQHW